MPSKLAGPVKQLRVDDRRAWRAWLERHAANATEVWVVLHKKESGQQVVTYDELVEEALCFGWVDSVVRTLDARRYVQRFTPRKSSSKWSPSNIARVERLQAVGQMAAAGLAAFATHAARVQAPHPTTLPSALEKVCRGRPRAWRYFNACPPGYRRTTIGWVASAKKDETRRRRLEMLMEACEGEERLKFI
jgi:uncharacterized protein YdeI (YjbR/CyaY-like superfamily)